MGSSRDGWALDYLVWTFLTRPRRSTWPAAYCSITSFTSYGFKASLNFRRATKYFICWEGKEDSLVCECECCRANAESAYVSVSECLCVRVFVFENKKSGFLEMVKETDRKRVEMNKKHATTQRTHEINTNEQSRCCDTHMWQGGVSAVCVWVKCVFEFMCVVFCCVCLSENKDKFSILLHVTSIEY